MPKGIIHRNVPPGFEVRPQTAEVPEGFTVREPESEGFSLQRMGELTGRTMVEGLAGIASPFANAAGETMNLVAQAMSPFPEATRGQRFFSNDLVGDVSQRLTDAGVAEPESGAEKTADVVGQIMVGFFGGKAPYDKVVQGLGVDLTRRVAQPAADRGARALVERGVQVDRAQRGGGRLSNLMRAGARDNPVTARAMEDFSEQQLRQYTRAVLQRIGVNADEASQHVMNQAKTRISGIFDDVAQRAGARFDDVLQDDIIRILNDAQPAIDDASYNILKRNVDLLLKAIGEGGAINGRAFTNIRSILGRASRHPQAGTYAREMQDSLMESLVRNAPDDAPALREAITQWRNMRIIEGAIGKDLEGFISPARLSNAIATKVNRAMSIYGQGGDQQLVTLARSGRGIIPDTIPRSGTAERSLLQAPIRAIAAGAVHAPASSYIRSQPAGYATQQARTGSARLVAPFVNALRERERELAGQ